LVTTDARGIVWFVATGQQGVIPQTRNESTDKRWSGNVSNVSQFGYEITSIFSFEGVSGDGHFALKHWGPNHSGDCGHSEGGDCCCWYDTGIRSNGDIQLQIERPHPSNEDFDATTTMNNIGSGMDGKTIGLKWLIYPRTPGGSADNGGIRLKMWVDTSGLMNGRPQNQWRLVYDIVDSGQIMGDYPNPNFEHDLENRVSDTDEVTSYGGGLHWRKLIAGDSANDTGNTNPPPPPPQSGNSVIGGVKMIYPPKEDGQFWFQDDDPEHDGRVVSDEEVINKVGDYFVASSEEEGDVFLRILTTLGDPFSDCNVDYSELDDAGTAFTADDWKNVEMTIFVYPQEVAQTSNENDTIFSIEARSSFSLDRNTIPSCCAEYRYAGVMYCDDSGTNRGRVRFTKAIGNNNVHRGTNVSQTVKTHFYRSWTGLKFIVYNTKGPNNEDWVNLEIWLCPSDSATDMATNWTKVHSFIDKGNNFGSGADDCGGVPAQAITWGTGYVAMRYNLNPEIRWKKWSVREIDHTAAWPVDPPPDPDPDPEPEPEPEPCPECPEGQHRSPTTNLCVPDEEEPPPPPPNTTLFKFVSWGDNDTTSNARAVLDKIMAETGISQYLFAGDGPYSTDSTDWIEMMTQYFDATKKAKLILSQGNHEHPESESQTAENQIEAWMPGLHNATEGLEWLIARKVGNVFIINMNSQDPNISTVGGAQYNWVQARLNEAKALRAAGTIDWIVTMVHKSWFNLLGTNPAYVLAREAYDEMFLDAQVDIMFHGHNHSYAIWRPVVAIPGNSDNTAADDLFTMASDGTTYDFSKSHGVIYVINGNGGHEINPWGEDPADFPNVLYANDQDFGYTILEIQGKLATIKAKNVNGTVMHTVNITRQSTTIPPPPPPPDEDEDGEILWDSNEHLITGSNFTVENTFGSQAVNGKGIYMAASGDPRLHVKANGEFELEADAGHGRFYAKACNYNARIQGELRFNDSSIDNTSIKLRNRHSMGGACENRFGGISGTIHRGQTGTGAVETKIEKCHNEHESGQDGSLPKAVNVGQWVGFKYTVKDTTARDGIIQIYEIDYKDGVGFRKVLDQTFRNPQDYYMDKDTFLDESEFWMRINNGATGGVSYRNVQLIDLDAPASLSLETAAVTTLALTTTDDCGPNPPPPPPPPVESIYNDLTLIYNINSDSDGCICNDPGFTPPPPATGCAEGQCTDPLTGLCRTILTTETKDTVTGLCVPRVVTPPPPGGENQSIYDIPLNDPSPDDVKIASESGTTSFYLQFGEWIRDTASTLYNKDIKRIEWPLKKSGNPTGTATVVIRKGSDNSIAKTLGTINVQDLTTSFEYQEVENTTTSYNMVVGDRILLEYNGGDDNDYIIARAVATRINGMKVTKRNNTQSVGNYSERDQEACFRAYA
jgi:Calcineurin-like phosphoesterase